MTFVEEFRETFWRSQQILGIDSRSRTSRSWPGLFCQILGLGGYSSSTTCILQSRDIPRADHPSTSAYRIKLGVKWEVIGARPLSCHLIIVSRLKACCTFSH